MSPAASGVSPVPACAAVVSTFTVAVPASAGCAIAAPVRNTTTTAKPDLVAMSRTFPFRDAHTAHSSAAASVTPASSGNTAAAAAPRGVRTATITPGRVTNTNRVSMIVSCAPTPVAWLVNDATVSGPCVTF